MNRLLIGLLSSFLLANIAWAHPTETPVSEKSARIDTNESQKNNSLPRGALAKQGIKVKLLFNTNSEAYYSRHTHDDGTYNSLPRGALVK